MKEILTSFRKKDVPHSKDIVVQCRGCGIRPSIEDIGCLRCICGHLKDSDALSLTLVSSNEMRYDGDALKELVGLSSSISEDAISTGDSIRCRNCGLCKDRIIEQIWESLTIENLDRISKTLDGIEEDCVRSSICKESVKASLTRMEDNMTESSERMRLLAHRFMGV